jgi:2-oxoisovalerate dehydrogenase E1 component beta subunit
MTEMTMAGALNLGLRHAMERDPKVLLLGEDIGRLGGVFRITEDLQKDFGERRVIDAPLAESAIVGTAIGMAIRGYRPVLEIQFDGFVYPAFDQIVSQLAKMFARTEGAVRLPIVIRIPFGGGIGAVEHHSESPETYFVHTPGLRVLVPSDPQAAYWTVQQAITSDDPVIYFEPKRRYWDKGDVIEDLTGAPDPWRSRILREGDDVTVVAYGPMVRTCLEAADQDDVPAMTVIDLQSLAPLDLAPVIESVTRTGRLVVVHEAPRTLGVGAEVAARIQQECFFSLEAPVQRVTGYDIPYPPSRLESHHLPNAERVLDAVEHVMDF